MPTGNEIAKRINARDEGIAVSRTLVMELVDSRGKKRLRETREFRKYYRDEKRDKGVLNFPLTDYNIKC